MVTEGVELTYRAGLTHVILCENQRRSLEYRNDETGSNVETCACTRVQAVLGSREKTPHYATV